MHVYGFIYDSEIFHYSSLFTPNLSQSNSKVDADTVEDEDAAMKDHRNRWG